MNHLAKLKKEIEAPHPIHYCFTDIERYKGYRSVYSEGDPNISTGMIRARVQAHWFRTFPCYVYEGDLVVGSIRGNYMEEIDVDEVFHAEDVTDAFCRLTFATNSDHYAPGYEKFLGDGIGGVMARIDASLAAHADEPDKADYLIGQRIVLEGFSDFIKRYAAATREKAEGVDAEWRESLLSVADDLDYISWEAPVTLRQALNLVWLSHIAFVFEGKLSMAFGRMDQYLYPYYRHDIDGGILTPEEAEDLLASMFIKIGEMRMRGFDDTCNIAIGGVKRDGSDAINELSYAILHAVRDCNIPGPNLTARLHGEMPDEFLDECLAVIATGLGYPALTNDKVNIPALARHGYDIEDARDYCFVGCIENFMPGKQPAWSDGRFNMVQFLETVFFEGRCALDRRYYGAVTPAPAEIKSMDEFMKAYEVQITFAASEYVALFNAKNKRLNYSEIPQHFMSLFSDDSIERGLDVNCGGTKYPSVHGIGCMGIATVADSLAAVEKLVFIDKSVTLTELADALAANFEGYEKLRQMCLACPKYGNNDDFVDKYAVWYVEYMNKAFAKYRTRDGGPFYTAIASNTQNVTAGQVTGATPDGRLSGVPVSDAASPTYGMDKRGPTSSFLSLCKPDYTLVSTGTVVNQKYTPDMLTDPKKRAALLKAIRVYFDRCGQEVQINCVSRETLADAMDHPEGYENMVVRVSGFSAYYVKLSKGVQQDILNRTEHSEIH